MKKIGILLVIILAFPSLTALAASSTSKKFVVRNWKAPASTVFGSTEEALLPTDDVGDEIIPPGDNATPVDEHSEQAAPAPTEEVEKVEQSEEQEDAGIDEVEQDGPEEELGPVDDHSNELVLPTDETFPAEVEEPPVDEHSGEEVEPEQEPSQPTPHE